MKNFNGKAIYNPSGKAGEYSYWACNFYVGCSNMCSYCYCKKGIVAKQLGGDHPTLKKCFNGTQDAMDTFKRELLLNRDELQKHGLFLSFTTDPCLRETYGLTAYAVNLCVANNIPVKILTKQFISSFTLFNWVHFDYHDKYKNYIAVGHTLTGFDELELNADTNKRRIESGKWLHKDGFKTFASIEPVIEFDKSLMIIEQSKGYYDLYKIGLMSGKKYDKKELSKFFFTVQLMLAEYNIYFKDSLLRQVGIDRKELPANCVNRDYNIFQSK